MTREQVIKEIIDKISNQSNINEVTIDIFPNILSSSLEKQISEIVLNSFDKINLDTSHKGKIIITF